MVVEAYILLKMRTDKSTYGTARSAKEKLGTIQGVETVKARLKIRNKYNYFKFVNVNNS